jgi:hypothetical protein
VTVDQNVQNIYTKIETEIKGNFRQKILRKKNQIGFCGTRNCDEVGALWAILVTFKTTSLEKSKTNQNFFRKKKKRNLKDGQA